MPKPTYPKLPKGFKTRWLKALRSGKYKQGGGELKDSYDNREDRYCCLGVAVEICGGSFADGHALIIPGVAETCQKPIPGVLIDTSTGGEGLSPVIEKLVHMNDGYNGSKPQSFKQIANWVERNL